MIEQYTITTTPKYNFPQPTINPAIPQHFFEQSLRSLEHGIRNPFQKNQQHFQQFRLFEQHPLMLQLNRQPIPLKPNHQETEVTALDTSTIKIGETSRGILIAIRGAIARKEKRNYAYTRVGPFIYHITEENRDEIYQTLERTCFGSHLPNNKHSTPNFQQIPSRLSMLLERWIQIMTAKTVYRGIILFDGSLTSGTIDTPTQLLEETLATARRNENMVLAFSKMTSLRVNGYIITDYLPNHSTPYVLETAGVKFKPPTFLLGQIYVVKLNKTGHAFRLDIDKRTAFQQRIEAVEKLLGNDLHRQGYPETLRLAHILCTFTANEIFAIKHFITRKQGINIINRPDMHKLLFGPFGRETYS